MVFQGVCCHFSFQAALSVSRRFMPSVRLKLAGFFVKKITALIDSAFN